MRRGTKLFIAVAAVIVVLAAIVGGWLVFFGPPPAYMPLDATNISTDVITRQIADDEPNAPQLRLGQYLLRAGDCMVCHTQKGGAPFAGGFSLNTPFGAIYSTNLTPDRDTGIGSVTEDQFYAALHNGSGSNGAVYPAMPYTYFTRITREDSNAMLAYLKSLPAVRAQRKQNELRFPYNIRPLVNLWNILFFSAGTYRFDPSQSAEWNRGAYLVTGPGHCGSCHTSKNALGADVRSQPLYGGTLDNWVAPDLTSNGRTGLGRWSVDEIVEYLRTGRNAVAGAAGPMADVVTYSTSLMNDGDLAAMAVYLKAQAASPTVTTGQPDAAAMRRGAAVYSDACSSCHLEKGVGQARLFPPLANNSMLQQTDPTGLLHLILAGGRIGATSTRPSPLAMPSFAWKLSDQEIADVSTYIRNSWDNHASQIDAAAVHKIRMQLDLQRSHLTVNSGDQK